MDDSVKIIMSVQRTFITTEICDQKQEFSLVTCPLKLVFCVLKFILLLSDQTNILCKIRSASIFRRQTVALKFSRHDSVP